MANEPQAATSPKEHQYTQMWVLIERYCYRYPDDWRLVFKRDDKTFEVSVPEEVWRAFDA